MFKKTLKVLSLIAILGLSANANDLLADISKGAISDNSLGVKVLNTEEMNKVHGGYIVSYFNTTFHSANLLQTNHVVLFGDNELDKRAVYMYGYDFKKTDNASYMQKNAFNEAIIGLMNGELLAISFTQTKIPQFIGSQYSYSYDPKAVNYYTGKTRAITGNSWLRNLTLNKAIRNDIYMQAIKEHGNFALGF
ncbi:hypothetical protein AVBRAN12654_09260 [Campylobacter sp. RM12654]|uniref:hypothetical protein n=1 Tax=unclassified Campylobacter TaxID=2593542 RepID=UPI001DB403CF|nr:hypothetical protein [Campylobacter sp. RM12654]MBZ7993341.1 hypothetical protein [Campylobacter sp. RM9333]